jgi:hypothetical protein
LPLAHDVGEGLNGHRSSQTSNPTRFLRAFTDR